MKMTAAFVTIIFLVSIIFYPSANANPSGPPVGTSDVCTTMAPIHGAQSQISPAPYNMTANSDCYISEQALTVTLTGDTPVQMFKGFFVQARKSGVDSMSHGTFAAVTGASGVQTLNCFSGTNNAFGHSLADEKTQVQFTWTPPSSLTGDIDIVATVVQVQATFWVKGKTLTLSPCSTGTTMTPSGSLSNETIEMTTTTTDTAATGPKLLLSVLFFVGLVYQIIGIGQFY